MKFILAGDYRQASHCAWSLQLNRTDWRAADPYNIRGRRDGELILFGTWRNNRDHEMVIDIARHLKFTVSIIDDEGVQHDLPSL